MKMRKLIKNKLSKMKRMFKIIRNPWKLKIKIIIIIIIKNKCELLNHRLHLKVGQYMME